MRVTNISHKNTVLTNSMKGEIGTPDRGKVKFWYYGVFGGLQGFLGEYWGLQYRLISMKKVKTVLKYFQSKILCISLLWVYIRFSNSHEPSWGLHRPTTRVTLKIFIFPPLILLLPIVQYWQFFQGRWELSQTIIKITRAIEKCIFGEVMRVT